MSDSVDPLSVSPSESFRKCASCGKVMLVTPGGTPAELCQRCRNAAMDDAATADSEPSGAADEVETRPTLWRAPELEVGALAVGRRQKRSSSLTTAIVAFLVAVPTTFATQTLMTSRSNPAVINQPIQRERNDEPEQRVDVIEVADQDFNTQIAQLEQRIAGLEQRSVELAQRKLPVAGVPVIPKAGDDDKGGDSVAVLKVLETLTERLDDHDKQLKAHTLLLVTGDKNVRDAIVTADKNLKDTFNLADRNVKAALKEADRNVRDALTVLTVTDGDLSTEIAALRRQVGSLKADVATLGQQVANLRR